MKNLLIVLSLASISITSYNQGINVKFIGDENIYVIKKEIYYRKFDKYSINNVCNILPLITKINTGYGPIYRVAKKDKNNLIFDFGNKKYKYNDVENKIYDANGDIIGSCNDDFYSDKYDYYKIAENKILAITSSDTTIIGEFDGGELNMKILAPLIIHVKVKIENDFYNWINMRGYEMRSRNRNPIENKENYLEEWFIKELKILKENYNWVINDYENFKNTLDVDTRTDFEKATTSRINSFINIMNDLFWVYNNKHQISDYDSFYGVYFFAFFGKSKELYAQYSAYFSEQIKKYKSLRDSKNKEKLYQQWLANQSFDIPIDFKLTEESYECRFCYEKCYFLKINTLDTPNFKEFDNEDYAKRFWNSWESGKHGLIRMAGILKGSGCSQGGCGESNSGNHAWKETRIESEIITYHFNCTPEE